MYPRSVNALQADALFASALQRSDELSVSQIRRAVAAALHGYGAAGCAGRVAQEFGDHPETAAVRMRWARAAVAALERQSSDPGVRPIAAASNSALAGTWRGSRPSSQREPVGPACACA